MDLRHIFKQNKTLVAILLFFSIYGMIYLWKPPFLFIKPNDTLRNFGIGYKNKTILPLWLFSILLGLLCYFFVIYYVQYPTIFI